MGQKWELMHRRCLVSMSFDGDNVDNQLSSLEWDTNDFNY